MTAGVLWLGLKLLGVQNVALYDEVSHDLPEIFCRLLIFASLGPDMRAGHLARSRRRQTEFFHF